ncbi:MAG: hypothetical protein IKN57_11610 [Parasporobacterium sp.]|nr:hypothetical protein [Parasporobacterium sp.]
MAKEHKDRRKTNEIRTTGPGSGDTEVMEKYGDIIDLEHYQPRSHPRMSLEQRAAQFAPFAALNGYEEIIEDVSRSKI